MYSPFFHAPSHALLWCIINLILNSSCLNHITSVIHTNILVYVSKHMKAIGVPRIRGKEEGYAGDGK